MTPLKIKILDNLLIIKYLKIKIAVREGIEPSRSS